MKTKFSMNYIMTHRGCYSRWQIFLLFLLTFKITFTLKDIIESKIPNKDKFWFLWNCCNFDYKKRKECYDQSSKTREIIEKYFPYSSSPGWVYNYCSSWCSTSYGSASEQNTILNDILEYSNKFNK